jgi:hypothetical protein
MRRLSLLLLLAVGCASRPDGDDDDDAVPVTDMAGYMAACEAALGELPEFVCEEGVEIPITVTDSLGATIDVLSESDLENGANCDRPLAVGGCIPHSRVGTKTNALGSTFTFVCRAYEFRAPGNVLYDDLGVIAQNPATGDSCFWAVPIDGHTFDGTVIPRPGSAEDASFYDDRGFWYTLPEIAGATCMRCHDNDPYIHTPAIEQTGQVPSQPLADYRVVAADDLNDLGNTSFWSAARTLVKDEADPCLACHRLSERFTCDLAQYAAGRTGSQYGTSQSFRQWPRSHWMDDFDDANLARRFATEADWDLAYGAAVDAITDCCNDPSMPGCWE